MFSLDISNSGIITFILGIFIPAFFYWYTARKFDYWKKRGIPFVKPYPIVGSCFDFFIKKLEDVELERYIKYGRIYGMFEGSNPYIYVAEPELVKNILVKDFQHFSSGRVIEINDPMIDRMLTSLHGEDWKRVRTIISPTFSTGKMKRLINIFKESSKSLIATYNDRITGSIDVFKVYGAFTIDTIASAAFSAKINTHKDPNNEFVQHAKAIFGDQLGFAALLFLTMPSVMKFLNISLVEAKDVNFFKSAITEIIKERKRTGEKRNDFLQLVLDAVEDLPKEENTEEKSDNILSNYGGDSANHEVFKTKISKHLSMDELVANCIVFFTAGYHTSSATLSLVTYFLALNQDIQERFFTEIKQTLQETNGEVTYEALQKMTYLDSIVSETLRIYSPAIRLERTAEADYKLGSTGITIPKGMIVGIPIFGMHRDPEFFPDPMKFNPDRFSSKEKDKIIPYSYLPFGSGPRNCVGMRFALLEIKVCLVYVFSNFVVKTGPETKVPIEFVQASGIIQPKSVDLRLEHRSDCPLKM